MSNNFTYYSPTKVFFGKNVEAQTEKVIRELGASKVLIVYGGQSAQRSGLLDVLRRSMEAESLAYVELGGVVPNPRLDKVYEGIRIGIRDQIDFLLAAVSLIQRKLSPMAWQSLSGMYGSFLNTHGRRRAASRLPAS